MDRFGLDEGTVVVLAVQSYESSPERAAYKRAWENAHRARCAGCGALMAAGTLRADGSRRGLAGDRCAACRSSHRVDLVLEMWRLRREEALSNKQIAERLETPVFTVTGELARMRALGYAVAGDPNAKRPAGRASGALDRSARSLGRALAERGIVP